MSSTSRKVWAIRGKQLPSGTYKVTVVNVDTNYNYHIGECYEVFVSLYKGTGYSKLCTSAKGNRLSGVQTLQKLMPDESQKARTPFYEGTYTEVVMAVCENIVKICNDKGVSFDVRLKKTMFYLSVLYDLVRVHNGLTQQKWMFDSFFQYVIHSYTMCESISSKTYQIPKDVIGFARQQGLHCADAMVNVFNEGSTPVTDARGNTTIQLKTGSRTKFKESVLHFVSGCMTDIADNIRLSTKGGKLPCTT